MTHLLNIRKVVQWPARRLFDQIKKRSLSTQPGLQIEEQLGMFPEYRESKHYESQGHFQKALPGYQRTFESLLATLGLDSPLTASLLFQIGNLHRFKGEYGKAARILDENIPKIQKSIESKIHLQQLLATIHVLSKENERAVQIARDAMELCEASNHHENSLSRLLSSTYGTFGICNLMNQDLHEAETFLQMSCRWAETPSEQLISSINNGALVWYRLANDSSLTNYFNYWKIQHDRILGEISFLSNQQTTKANQKEKSEGNEGKIIESLKKIDSHSSLYKENVLPTLQNWLEMMEEAQKGHIATGVTGCGPMNMTGLQSQDVTIASQSTNSPPQKEEEKTMTSFETRLQQDVHLAIAYAHLLYRISEIYLLSGNLSDSSEYLSSAMKAIDHHHRHQQESPGQALAVAPILGKILRQIGFFQMATAQAVTAEGLYRSSLEKLQSPHIVHDLRYQYEHAITLGYYGQLLQKWEKREALGQKSLQQYQQFLQQHYPPNLLLPPDSSHKGGIFPLSSMLHFPIDYISAL